MTYQEKRSYTQFVGNIIGFIIFWFYLSNELQEEIVTMRLFGKYVLILVPILVLAQFITKFLFDAFNRTHEKGEEPKKMDELDKIIELKAVRNFCFAFLGGFFITLFLFYLEVDLLVCLYTMIAGIFVAGNTIEISYIYYYKKGV